MIVRIRSPSARRGELFAAAVSATIHFHHPFYIWLGEYTRRKKISVTSNQVFFQFLKFSQILFEFVKVMPGMIEG